MNETTLGLTKTPKQKLAHIAEECAEFLQAYAKYQRFGMWPESLGVQYDNFQDMHDEIQDIKLAIERFDSYITNTPSGQRYLDFK